MKCACGNPCAPTPLNVVSHGGVVFEDCYLIMFNHDGSKPDGTWCGSTRAVLMWESEAAALEGAEEEPEPVAAE